MYDYFLNVLFETYYNVITYNIHNNNYNRFKQSNMNERKNSVFIILFVTIYYYNLRRLFLIFKNTRPANFESFYIFNLV